MTRINLRDLFTKMVATSLLCVLGMFCGTIYSQNLRKAHEITQKLSIETDHFKTADLLLQLSEVEGLDRIESALEHAQRALTIYQNIKNKEGEMRALTSLGKLELLIGNDPVARSYFNKAYSVADEIGGMKAKVKSKILLGKSYTEKDVNHIGLGHLNEALETALKIKNEELLTECYSALGDWYTKLTEYNTAIGYFDLALETANNSGIESLIADCLANLGNGYLKSDDNDLAYDSFDKALHINEKLVRKDKQAILCYELGCLKQEKGLQDEALVYFRTSLTLATEIGLKDYIAKGYQVLSEVYEGNHNYENAYRFLKLVNAIKGVSEISELETQIQNQKILRENQMLKQQQEARKAEAESRSERIMLFVVIVVLLCIAVAYLFFINQQKQKTNNELAEAKLFAEESEREKEKFLTYTSHEIRTPLNAVVGVTQLLEQTNLDLGQKEYLNTIKGSAQNILHIVNDVLDLSKIESGSIELESVDLPLYGLVNNIINTLIFKLHNKEVELINDFDESIPENLRGDPVRLNQIILNLTDNAVKFTRTGEIRIKVRLVEERDKKVKIKFTVSDTGKGIRQSSLKQIFNRYEQETVHTTRNYGGTGLGLPITQQLVELMGGNIEVESTFGSGTSFSFELEFKKSAGEIIEEPIQEINDINILYVDDNQLNRELFYDLVSNKKNNVKVDLAEDGKQAIRKIEKNKYDVLLLDIQMPRMDGYELCTYIREKMNLSIEEAPIYALTAYAPDDIKDRCKEVGMNGYLTKPIDLKALNNVLNLEMAEQAMIKDKKELDFVGKYTDLTGLHQLVNRDHKKIAKYVSISLESLPKDLEDMQNNLDHEDWELLGRVAHKMKSNAGYMGMNKVLPILHELEKLKETVGEYELIEAKVMAIETESLLALDELKNILNTLNP
ncbi:MAG: signal transduction histidine kinase/DNA-binding NarL/FixJ family response regulator [Parvicellaceae bacterium]|jgi:signal transduction histidine kinase/DNA-binding NarL/FixJ family response regulator